MSENTVTVSIPDRLYRQLRLIAETTHRPIADILLESAAAMLPPADADNDLPSVVADELAALHALSDEALWRAAEPVMLADQQDRLSELTRQQADRTLSSAEETELNDLLAEYDRSVVRRAQALALLALRGHPIPDLNLPTAE